MDEQLFTIIIYFCTIYNRRKRVEQQGFILSVVRFLRFAREAKKNTVFRFRLQLRMVDIGILITLSRTVHVEQSSNRVFHAPFRRVMNSESHRRKCRCPRSRERTLPKSFTSSPSAPGEAGKLCNAETRTVEPGRAREEEPLPPLLRNFGISFNFSHRNEFNFAEFTIPWNFINAIFQGVPQQKFDRSRSSSFNSSLMRYI